MPYVDLCQKNLQTHDCFCMKDIKNEFHDILVAKYVNIRLKFALIKQFDGFLGRLNSTPYENAFRIFWQNFLASRNYIHFDIFPIGTFIWNEKRCNLNLYEKCRNSLLTVFK